MFYVLCTTLNGSKYIQDCFENMLNCNSYFDNVNGHAMILNENAIRSTIFDFFDEISSFGHLLCIDKYAHYTIEKFLIICYHFSIINVLKQFLHLIIVKNFSMLMKHSYPCRIVQNMLNSNLIKLKIYGIAQLNVLFYPQQRVQQQLQQQQQQIKQNNPQTATNLNNVKKTASVFDRHEEKSESNNVQGVNDFRFLYDTMTDHIGNYIIQAMIDCACQINMIDDIFYIFNFIFNNNSSLSCDKFACRVVQRCITSHHVPQAIKQNLMLKMYNSIATMCNNEYGNYCVQKCIEYGEESIKDAFIETILLGFDLNVQNYSNSKLYNARYTLPSSLKSAFENYILNVQNPTTIINFSKFGFGRYSSIVSDVAIKYSTYEQHFRLINYLCNENISIKYNVLFGLINHEYGNFVIKNLINILINLQSIDIEKGETKYTLLLNKLKQTLNMMFQFTSKYHCQNKFSYSHNIIQLINSSH